MFNDITLGQYFEADSALHRLDPRTKILLTIVYMVAVFLVDTLFAYAVLAVFLFVVIRLSKVPVGKVLRSVKPLLFILVFTFILNLFFTRSGDVLFAWGIIAITTGGVRQSVFLALRLLFLVMGTSIMTLTTSPIAMTDGLEQLFSPLKVIRFPAHEMAMMMSIALRMIPTLLDEANKTTKAQMARGADFESGHLLARARAMIPVLVPLFVSAFRRADELALAMESRCYHGGEGRTRMQVLHFGRGDALAAAVMLLLIATLLVLRRFPIGW